MWLDSKVSTSCNWPEIEWSALMKKSLFILIYLKSESLIFESLIHWSISKKNFICNKEKQILNAQILVDLMSRNLWIGYLPFCMSKERAKELELSLTHYGSVPSSFFDGAFLKELSRSFLTTDHISKHLNRNCPKLPFLSLPYPSPKKCLISGWP